MNRTEKIIRDISELQRKIKIMDETITEARNVLAETITPTVKEIEKRNEKIDLLASEMEHWKRLKENHLTNIEECEAILAAITRVYEENARLNEQRQQDQQQIEALLRENTKIKAKLNPYEHREAEKYERLILGGIRIREVPEWLRRDCRFCQTLYIVAFRVDRGTSKERYQEDLDFLDSEIAMSKYSHNEALTKLLIETKDIVRWGPQVFDQSQLPPQN